MAINLDYNKGDNKVALYDTLPDNSTGDLLLDFTSEYSGEEINRPLNVEQQGAWIVGTLPQDRIPYTGTYNVVVHDTVQDHLALKDIHVALKNINVPLKDIVGPSRSEVLTTIRAIVDGFDNPEITQNSAKTITTPEPAAKEITFNQPQPKDTTSKTNRL